MLGIDLYKEILLNGEKYKGKEYKGKNGKTYTITKSMNEYVLHEIEKSMGVINMEAHEDKCIGINEFMLTELEEVKQEIEMPWQECLVKYIENPEKYYMKAIEGIGLINIFTNIDDLCYNSGTPISMNFIKTSRWFLCER